MNVRILLLNTNGLVFTEKFNEASRWLADSIGGYDWHMKVGENGVYASFSPSVDEAVVTMFKLRFGV
jgi:hypothetical protein